VCDLVDSNGIWNWIIFEGWLLNVIVQKLQGLCPLIVKMTKWDCRGLLWIHIKLTPIHWCVEQN